MKILFWLFGSYGDANDAVKALAEESFESEEMNVLVREETAKVQSDINWEKASVRVTDEIGQEILSGLDKLVAGERPVVVSGDETVIAAGDVATIVAKTAAAPGAVDDGLKRALIDASVPEGTAGLFAEGIERGGVLLWLRADDDRAGEALDLVGRLEGPPVESYVL